MKALEYKIKINAPKEKVWQMMLGLEGFKRWASVFSEGSYYEGHWEKGEKLRFLMPGGEGMASEVVELVPFTFSSIKHLHPIKNGIEQSDDQSGFTYPAYENYSFNEQNGSTLITVNIETPFILSDQMDHLFPKALAKLKLICE
jgi:hypothetical protein